MRLKVKGDTFFLPSSDGSVYFRNNMSSFRMEGISINQWIEKLMPIFNGEHSLQEVTNGLPEQYQERVYEIAEVLFTNGFVRDVSRDHPHQLKESVQQKFASQIEFLDSFEGSGAYRFQLFRQSRVLAIGAGSFMVSLMKSLLESGMPQIQMVITNPESTNRKRILELEEYARLTDPLVKLDEIHVTEDGVVGWRKVIEPFDVVFFVSHESEEAELKALHQACRDENKILLPALIMKQAGIAGPLVHPNSRGCWESARRRIHHSAIHKVSTLHTVSSTAEAMLANVIVFEWLKTAAEVAVSELYNKIFLLNLETLEGNWHPFLPHPLAAGIPTIHRIEDFEQLIENQTNSSDPNRLIPYFSRLTSSEIGIFHRWEEGELRQLPLSQCSVQVADPLSAGPSELLPVIICNGISHEEARKEAGLAGIEAYMSRMSPLVLEANRKENPNSAISSLTRFVGIGAGETFAEGISRGLQKCLFEALRLMLEHDTPSVSLITLDQVDDEQTRYYLRTLNTMKHSPAIGYSEALFGFPVAWVGVHDCWYGEVDFDQTRALRRALQRALLDIQNKNAMDSSSNSSGAVRSAVNVTAVRTDVKVCLPVSDPLDHYEPLRAALRLLKDAGKTIDVFDLASEAFLKEELGGVFGVSLRGEAAD
ncbi:putative thiazole-containing bacteriocin maturation protein [Paenibacillus sp. FSL H8-0548]|nr:putative thiazole-containing bacteriocin maturation protein [Paenibacillus sp. FSL H8-0548]